MCLLIKLSKHHFTCTGKLPRKKTFDGFRMANTNVMQMGEPTVKLEHMHPRAILTLGVVFPSRAILVNKTSLHAWPRAENAS